MFKKLLEWSKDAYIDLPWRRDRTVYKTLVSEIMLQQTTVGTVQNHFERFLKIYPDVHALSKTSEEEICVAWKGLGYYRRARNLRKAAIDIVENYDGKIPGNYEDLITITGVGEYTANAILSIGQNKNALAIDANIERVVSRIYGIQGKKGPKLQKLLKKKFEEGEFREINKCGGREINEALMDLGRIYCQARSANCLGCPVKKKCIAGNAKDPLEYPEIPVKKIAKTYELELLRIIVNENNSILGYKKSDDEWLAGQVECPTFILKSEDKNLMQYPHLDKKLSYKKLKKYKTAITKYKITNYILELSTQEFKDRFSGKFRKYKLTDKLNISTATTKALAKLS
ncbi:putative A/G-specific adenine glycosylase [Halobacteriovorax sp. BALOs_7]|uniref:Adenine DNA glycosylase n=1 Tax=Halobacteriovorax vibrionivorans TaxID=2152716 RepID=A0ABY0IJN3_9BACT|nr:MULTISPECIES: A/G-specific adenine glycosylase [Halobacteriovorax]AYF45803.1 putative A/G-specific adenine glycosylase [Halobacteriovorax sp. BALOs_7]RZF22842.1 A/G-specific adenine glycosylase [Halobacteriovorax vibrionivorans]TGD47365.1 A/G-specific adenine glycosylase [Halobacteriovorax sp. Y22]